MSFWKKSPVQHVKEHRTHMATFFEFTLSCEEGRASRARALLSEAHERVAELERELSEFLPESPIHALNHSAPGTEVPMSPAALELLERSRKLRLYTQGSFNPEAKGSAEVRSRACFEWDFRRGVAWRIHPEARVGFGAIGKGYALDQVRAMLEREGFQDYLLCAGGSSIILSGFSAPGTPWSWGWSWKKDEDGSLLGARLSHPSGRTLAIGVSGTQEKGSHLIDSRAESSALTESLQSALVGHSSAADADALSTALFVAGWDEARSFMKGLPLEPAIAAIDSSGYFQWNGIFQRWWGPLSRAFGTAMLVAFALPFSAFAEEAVDLGEIGAEGFTPYVVERDQWWILLPVLSALLVLLHLKKPKGTHEKTYERKVEKKPEPRFLHPNIGAPHRDEPTGAGAGGSVRADGQGPLRAPRDN